MINPNPILGKEMNFPVLKVRKKKKIFWKTDLISMLQIKRTIRIIKTKNQRI